MVRVPKPRRSSAEAEAVERVSRRRAASGRPRALGWALLTSAVLVLGALACLEPHDPVRARLHAEAHLASLWRSYHQGNFEHAYAQAMACARAWESEAALLQTNLRAVPGHTTAIGPVEPAEQRRILARTALNGAAVCFHVAGRSAEALRQPDAARSAYEATMRFPDGRSLDREGVLWSPAAASEALLHRLR
jgi:hypothetical protein